jgi:2-C-methyl-D-erythritol 4-phosphate cytidylyltransferase
MNDLHKKKVVAIVPAAGLGKRFGPGINKPFLNLSGKPLVIWTLSTLQEVPDIAEIIPVLKGEDMEYGQRIFEEHALTKIRRIAPGGKERQDSVNNALKLIEDKKCIVLVHDGVRPLIGRELIEEALKHMVSAHSSPSVGRGGEERGFDGVVLGVPVKDTIKEAVNSVVKRTLKRDSLWAVQTPQIFPYRKISEAYAQAFERGFYSTDDAALVEQYGGKIKVVMGSYRNIKITTPEDMYIAETLLRITPNN